MVRLSSESVLRLSPYEDDMPPVLLGLSGFYASWFCFTRWRETSGLVSSWCTVTRIYGIAEYSCICPVYTVAESKHCRSGAKNNTGGKKTTQEPWQNFIQVGTNWLSILMHTSCLNGLSESSWSPHFLWPWFEGMLFHQKYLEFDKKVAPLILYPKQKFVVLRWWNLCESSQDTYQQKKKPQVASSNRKVIIVN